MFITKFVKASVAGVKGFRSGIASYKEEQAKKEIQLIKEVIEVEVQKQVKAYFDEAAAIGDSVSEE